MSAIKKDRIWIAGGVVVAVVVAAAAWLLVVSPKLSQSQALRSNTALTDANNQHLAETVGTLRQALAHIGALRSQRDAARAALPTDNGLAAFTRQVAAQASAAHVRVTMVTANDPTPAVSPSAPAPATDPASTSSSATEAPVAAPTTAAAGLYGIPLQITVAGSTSNDARFVNALRHGGRAALVSSVTVDAGTATTGGSSGAMTMTVALQVFVDVPPAAATPSVAAAVTPVAAPTPAG